MATVIPHRTRLLDRMSVMTDRPIVDHTAKGSIIGLFAYILMHYHVDPVLISLLMPLAAAVLGKLSMMHGGCSDVASFWARYK